MGDLSEFDYKEFVLEIQKIGLIKKWWGDLYTKLGRTKNNTPIIYRNSIYKYMDAYLKTNQTKDQLDLSLIEVIKGAIPKKFIGYSISIMDDYEETTEMDQNTFYFKNYIL